MTGNNLENEVVKHNAEMLTGKDFFRHLCRESIGGNAGSGHSAVNSYINSEGKIMEFSNYPTKNPYERATFMVDMSYVFPHLKSKHKMPFIDGIYFIGSPEILSQENDGIDVKLIKFDFPSIEKNNFKISESMVNYMIEAVKQANKINANLAQEQR